jgi:3D (Asp-Asp-Asp) domain-containing protein
VRTVGRQLVLGLFCCGLAAGFLGCGRSVRRSSAPAPLPSGEGTAFTATAYSGGGLTASGTVPHPGVVAADPAVIPLGSRIRVRDAGEYSGEYVVRDTGGAIRGRKIDLYMSKHAQAKRFGRRTVKVEVVQYGDGRRVGCTHCRRKGSHRTRRAHHGSTHRHTRATAASNDAASQP